MGGVIKKGLNPFGKPALTGGIVGFDDPFRTGASSTKRLAEQQAKEYQDALKRQQEEDQKQRNVANAESKLAEDAMFEGTEDGLGIDSVDLEGVGGKRKRRKLQQDSGGLGI